MDILRIHVIAPGNGGKTDRYTWTQTLSELSVVIELPKGTITKQLVVEMKNKRLKVAIKGGAVLVDGELYARVVVDDSCWTLEDGCELNINLQKENRMEWYVMCYCVSHWWYMYVIVCVIVCVLCVCYW